MSNPPQPIEVRGLEDCGSGSDDGQAHQVASSVARFIDQARSSLVLALYDIRLPDPVGSIVADSFRAAIERGVEVKLAYNTDTARPEGIHPPPETRPEILNELPIETKGISGVPDLMHHKYMVRDGAAVWTGSANWSIDSWTRQENVLATIESPALARAYAANFEEIWSSGRVERSGMVRPEPAKVAGAAVTPWFTPGHGEELSQRIATRLGVARRRIRIASPVITSAPILGTLAEYGDSPDRIDIAGVIDEPQTDRVFEQWARTSSNWKAPLLSKVLTALPFSGKRSVPWGSGELRDFMHAKVTVVDDTVFLGSFNLSRSGEQNAENMIEIESREVADGMADFIDRVRSRYPQTSVPAASDRKE